MGCNERVKRLLPVLFLLPALLIGGCGSPEPEGYLPGDEPSAASNEESAPAEDSKPSQNETDTPSEEPTTAPDEE